MRIAILTQHPNSYAVCRLRQAARVLGHRADLLDPMKLFGLTQCGRSVVYNGAKGGKRVEADIVIPRFSHTVGSYGELVLGWFEGAGSFVLNGLQALGLARNKLRTLQRLTMAGVAVPRSVLLIHPDQVTAGIKKLGGVPVVAKVLQGSQGRGVLLARSESEVRSILDLVWNVRGDVFLQEFIAEANGSDVRVIVVGGKVVAAMRRVAQSGEFRSNLHLGGTGSKITLEKRCKYLALKSVKAIGLDVAGVDIVRSERGWLVLEVNHSPGLEGIEEITGINVAERIVRYAVWRAKKHLAKHRDF